MDMDEVLSLFENGVQNDDHRELLAGSLFYYCSGNDPTPILYFGNRCSLYVYVDLWENFEESKEKLYAKLNNSGYDMFTESRIVKLRKCRYRQFKNAELTKWKEFFILYIQGDANESFEAVYRDADACQYENYIQPKVICNFSYDLFYTAGERRSVMFSAEKRVEYVMGHCFSEKYKLIDSIKKYMGGNTVNIFHRKYWYVL